MKKHIHTHLIVNTQINEFKETHQSTITLQLNHRFESNLFSSKSHLAL